MNDTLGKGLLVFVLSAQPALAQSGVLLGTVKNATTGEAIASAQVTIVGTRLTTLTNAGGQFRFANVSVAAREVRVRRVGFQEKLAQFVLKPDDTLSVPLSMQPSPQELDEVIVTGTAGDDRRRAIGNSVAVVNATEAVAQSAITNLDQLLQARVPGLSVTPTSGTVGAAAISRLRGAGSINANNSPTFWVDGIRVNAKSEGNYNAFGQGTTALDAISLADLESVEVVRGPSATTLYGAEAAAGVIQLLTKRGQPGPLRWESRFEVGRNDWDDRLRPVNYAVADSTRLADTTKWPGFKGRALGDVISYRPMTEDGALRVGRLSRLVVSVSGGTQQYVFRVSATKANEEGVFYNNAAKLFSLRGNFSFTPSGKFSFTTNMALSQHQVRLPINDNAGGMGLINSSYLAVPGLSYVGGRNFASLVPDIANAYDNQTEAQRIMIGATMRAAPWPWFRNTLVVGIDANVSKAELYFAPDVRAPFAQRASLLLPNSAGFIAQGRPANREVTFNYDGTATRRMSPRLTSNTSVGWQYLANQFSRIDAIGHDIGVAGLRSVNAAATKISRDSSSAQKSLGVYVQQQFSFNDRLFAAFAMRVDNNSAFGARLSPVLYPKASVSYVISDEPRFRIPNVNSLRLRAAWGQAGNSPAPFDAARTYSSSVVTYASGTSYALRYVSPGNPNLRPERGSETEMGVDAALFEGRVVVDFSYYRKRTFDALLQVDVPISTGFTGKQYANLGEISNSGVELSLTATPIRRKDIAVDATLTLATNRNQLVSFGDGRDSMPFGNPGITALSQRYQEGYPLGAYWAQRPQYNSDGSLRKVNGQPVPDSTRVYVGPSAPTREIALSSGVTMFGKVTVFALAHYKGGHFQFNGTDLNRDRAVVTWETVNPSANTEDVLVRKSSSQTFLYIQRADFIKLRDISVRFDVPSGLLFGAAQRVSLTGAGHNLRIWTKYGGADPELNDNGAGNPNRNDLWTVPQTRRYSASVTVWF